MNLVPLLSLLAAAAPIAGHRELVTVQAPAAVVMPGGGVEIRIALTVADGFHVQANPPSDELLIPVRFELPPADGIAPGRITYPPGKPFRLNGSESDLLVYDGSFEIVATLAAGPTAKPGEHLLRGKVGYQACDATSCRPPTSTPVALSVRVVPPRAGAPETN